MFSNVTGKVSGWLPTSLPTVSMPTVSMPTMPNVSMPAMPSIPGLRKSQPAEDGTAEVATEQAEEAQPQVSATEKDDDDRSRYVENDQSILMSSRGRHDVEKYEIYIKRIPMVYIAISFES